MLVLITDGEPNDYSAANSAAQAAKDAGITLITVGVGQVNNATLSQVCTEPSMNADVAYAIPPTTCATAPALLSALIPRASTSRSLAAAAVQWRKLQLQRGLYRIFVFSPGPS